MAFSSCNVRLLDHCCQISIKNPFVWTVISDSAPREAGWSGTGGVPEEETGGGQRGDETQSPAGSQVSLEVVYLLAVIRNLLHRLFLPVVMRSVRGDKRTNKAKALNVSTSPALVYPALISK